VHNIIGVMDDKLEDLLRMKPRPDGYTDTLAPEIRMGEFIVKDQNTGKVLHEGEIRG